MTTHQYTLGICPVCTEGLPEDKRLAEYRVGSTTSVFAEWPACLAVVHPR